MENKVAMEIINRRIEELERVLESRDYFDRKIIIQNIQAGKDYIKYVLGY